MKKVILKIKKRFFKSKSPSKIFMRTNIDAYMDAFKEQKGDSEKMTSFILLKPFKYGEEKEQIIMNIDCIKCVSKDNDYFSKVFVSDELKPFLKEQLTADEFLYVTEPRYEDIVAILTRKGDNY